MDASDATGGVVLVAADARTDGPLSALYRPGAICYAVAMPKGVAPDPLFTAEVLRHVDALHHFASYLCRDAVAAEDLVQETFARCFSARDSFREGTDHRAWLFRILRNAFI